MDKKFQEYKGLDLSQVNKDVLKEWESNNTFEQSLKNREGHPSFVFFEGPPSANGMPGIHHVMARTIKDIICRYKTLQGFLVERKAGWDTHGLPVELGVEKKLGITKEDIGTKISIEEYNDTCRRAVMEFTDVFDEQDGILGRHEQPVHHLRQPLHRNFVVSVETIVRERVPVQGLHDTTLFPGCRNRIKHARVEPTGMLPGCEGHDMRGSIQSDPG